MLCDNKRSEEIAEVLSIREKQENEKMLRVRNSYHEKDYKRESSKVIIKILNVKVVRFELV